MRRLQTCLLGALLFSLCVGYQTQAQEQSDGSTTSSRTLRPVIRGTRYAVSSMKPLATEAAVRILEAGGNAFDAAVAGQAVLALVNPESNGFGSDAVALVYNAREKKVHSINAEGTAPKLATIDWYNKNNGGRIPDSDGLLSASLPGVIDAWYIMLDRWGTMTFAQVLEQAIDVAENGYPIGEGLSRAIAGSKKIQKYPTTMKVYFPNGRAPQPGELFRNLDSARMLRKLVDAEKAAARKGRHEALRAARDRFYKGDIARTMGDFSEKQGGLFRYEDFAAYTDKVETPVSIDYRGYEVYKNASSSQGPAELFMLNILEGFDSRRWGYQPTYIHTSAEGLLAFADRELLGDTDFVRIPSKAALEGVCDGAPETHRCQQRIWRSVRAVLSVHETDQLGGPRARRQCGRGGLFGGRHQLHRSDRQGPQHGELRAESPQRLRHRCRDGRPRVHLQLPRRLLLTHTGRAAIPRAGEAPAQHAAEHARDERRPALDDHRQPGRRRSDPSDRADAAEPGRLRHERAGGDRSAALVDQRLRVLGVSAPDEPSR